MHELWYLFLRSEDETKMIYKYYTNDIDAALLKAMELETDYPNCVWELENINFLRETEEEKATDSHSEE